MLKMINVLTFVLASLIATSSAAAPLPQEKPAILRDTLARAALQEAEGDGYEGMLAVANVILNRAEDHRWPNTVRGVVFQPRQFEAMAPDTLRRQWSDASVAQALIAADMARKGVGAIGCRGNGRHARTIFWFHSGPPPYWAGGLYEACRVGGHVFYRGYRL